MSCRRSPRVERNAGAKPTSNAHTPATTPVYVNTTVSIDTSPSPRTSRGARPTSTSSDHQAITMPPIADTIASAAASASNRRITPRSRRAQRHPQGQFSLARHAARRHQVGEVHAGDQQYAGDGREQEEQRPPRAADDRVELRHDLNAAAAIVRGIRLRQAGHQPCELRLSTGQAGVWTQPTDDLDECAPRCAVIGVSAGFSTRRPPRSAATSRAAARRPET